MLCKSIQKISITFYNIHNFSVECICFLSWQIPLKFRKITGKMLITQECTLRLYLRAHFNIRNTCYDGMRCAKSSVRMNVMVICLCTYLSLNLHPTVVCSCRVQSEGCTLWRYVRAQSIVKNARYGTEYLRAHSNVKKCTLH